MNTCLQKEYHVAAYIRLSKEDMNSKESESITNQRSLLLRYIEENSYTLEDIYIDDGYSGTNFDRPGFKRMLKDIEQGRINMVITKDMSRLGRDYIKTGEYIEKYFPEHNIRYIALTDNVDTALDSTNNDIAPFKAIMNDYYAKDISKKIKTSLRTKQKDGKWVGGCPPLGYMKDPNDKNHLIPNDKEAQIIKKIFNLANKGLTANEIKNYLIENEIPTSSELRYNIKTTWSLKTVIGILKNELYTGNLVQNRRNKINYKLKKIIKVPKEEWIIVPNTHEPLVSKDTFESINKILTKTSNRNTKKERRLLDGLLYCHECSHKIMICNPRKSDGRTYLACNNYRMNSKQKVCTSHSFNYDYIEESIIKIIKNLINPYINDNNVIELLISKFNREKKIDKLQIEIDKCQEQIMKLHNNLDKMYLDKLDGIISDLMYERLKQKITDDLIPLEETFNYLSNTKENLQTKKLDIDLCKKILKDFNPSREMIIMLIDKLEISKDKKVDIYFNFLNPNIIIEEDKEKVYQ